VGGSGILEGFFLEGEGEGGVSKNVIFVIFVSWSLLPGSDHQREDVGPLWL
jgi:hypothetical protein